ncbi:MAG: hypothetical protein U0359_05120 [Byssovorax sp.]
MGAISGTGMTERVIPFTKYNFANVVHDGSLSIRVAQHIDVGPFTEVDLAVRVLNGTIGTGASILVDAFADGWTAESPATEFIDSSRSLANVTIDHAASLTLPLYSVKAFATGFGRLVSISVSCIQATGTAVACDATISIDLVMKGGDPAGLASRQYNTLSLYSFPQDSR